MGLYIMKVFEITSSLAWLIRDKHDAAITCQLIELKEIFICILHSICIIFIEGYQRVCTVTAFDHPLCQILAAMNSGMLTGWEKISRGKYSIPGHTLVTRKNNVHDDAFNGHCQWPSNGTHSALLTDMAIEAIGAVIHSLSALSGGKLNVFRGTASWAVFESGQHLAQQCWWMSRKRDSILMAMT